jgi:predicted PurR-regulated permease PerM
MILVGWFGMGTPFISVLFSYFVLNQLMFLKRKWLTVAVFCALVLVLGTGLVFFLEQAFRTLPRVAETALPAIIQYAQDFGLQLPFTDWDSLKTTLMDTLKGEVHLLGNFAKVAAKKAVLLLIGMVVAISLFINPASFLALHTSNRRSVYAVFCEEIAARFRSLYNSFATVMGAQLIISTLNTGLTALFLLFTRFPNGPLVIGLTFLCGLVPIVGNLISNSIIVGVAFTVSPQLALWFLGFLVTIHKLEYFLNSKIIGDRIQNPVWLTLIGLIIGERLMGISGMILAPVLLHYLKVEASQIEAQPPENDPHASARVADQSPRSN